MGFPEFSEEWNATCGQRPATVRVTAELGAPYLQFSMFLNILTIVTIPISFVIFFIARQKFTYIRKRNFAAIILCGLGAILSCVVGPLRDVLGRETFPCDVAMWVRIFAVVLMSAPVIYMLNFFRDQLLWNRALAAISFHRLQEVLNEAGDAADPKGRNKSLYNKGKVTDMRQSNHDDEVGSEKGSHTNTRIDSGASSFDDSAFASAMYKQSLKYKLIVMIMPFLLPIILGLVLQFSLPYYGHDCVGCIDEPFFIAVLQGTVGVLLGAILWTSWSLRGVPDPLDIIGDLKRMVLGGSGIGMPGLLGLMIDKEIGRPYDRGVFSFDWMIAISVLWFFVFLCPVPVFMAYRSSRRVESSKIKIDFKSLLANSQFQRIFGEHLVNEWSVENLKFYNQVNSFRDHYHGFKTSKQANLVALQTFETFISPGSVMEVNISANEREKLMTEFQTLLAGDGLAVIQMEKTVFDRAQAEIMTLMEKDSFRRFQRTKTYQAFATANLIVNPANNMMIVAAAVSN